MRGILALLFFCVTLFLADGNRYGRHHKQHLCQESEPLVYRVQENRDEKNGPITILGRALLETAIVLLLDPPEIRPTEDRSPSEVSDVKLQEPSESFALRASSRQRLNMHPGFRSDTSSLFDDKESEGCYVRRILDVLSEHVLRAQRKFVQKHGYPPRGPSLLIGLIDELLENLDSIYKIEEIDEALLKHIKVIHVFCRMLRMNFKNQCCANVEKKHFLAIVAKTRLFIQDFIDISEEGSSSNKAPSINLLLNVMKNILLRIKGESSIEENHLAEHSRVIKLFVQDAQTLVHALTKEILNIKEDYKSKTFDLKEILVDVDKTLKELTEEDSLFEKGRQSDEFFRKLLMRIEEVISNIVSEYGASE